MIYLENENAFFRACNLNDFDQYLFYFVGIQYIRLSVYRNGYYFL